MTHREQASDISADLLVVNTWTEVPTMTTVLLPSTDPRGAKAVALAADAGQWIKCRTSDGRKAYGIPSSKPGRYYLVTRYTCDCKDAEYSHECKHMLAVRLHCELVAEQREQADVFRRFDYDEDRAMARILGRPLPKTVRED
jgi:hypothetical protein